MGLIERVRLLLPHCADLGDAYGRAVLNGHDDVAALPPKSGAPIEPEDWPTPLIQAAMFGRAETVRRLAESGAPSNDDPCGSALHIAALNGDLDLVKLLVELGADHMAEAVDDTPSQFTPPDRTPLGWARYLRRHTVAQYLAAMRNPNAGTGTS